MAQGALLPLSARVVAAVSLLSLAALAHARPSCEPAAVVEPSQPALDSKPHSGTVVEMTGLHLGVGRRIADLLYVGAMGEWGPYFMVGWRVAFE